MKPILRGVVRYPDDGRTIWEGRWAMNATAFEESDMNQLHSFRYTCPTRVNFNVGDSVSFKGYFEVSALNKGSKSQFTDKQLEMEVTGVDESRSLRMITGKGSNRFGPFQIDGTFDPSKNVLEVQRIYGPKQTSNPSQQPAIASAIQPPAIQAPTEQPLTASSQEEVSSSAQSDVKSPSMQPQSPSSPVDMASSPRGTRAVKKEPHMDLTFYPEAKNILRELKARDVNKWFSSPVDAVALGLHDYHGVVKNPMDLGTIQNNLEAKHYQSWESCLSDMRLVFFNALMYNPRSSLVYKAASDLNALLDEHVKRVILKSGKALDESLLSSAIGKRVHKKKKFFEPGDGGGSLYSSKESSSTINPASSTKKTPKNTAKVPLPTASVSAKKSNKAKAQPSQSVPKRMKPVKNNVQPPAPFLDFSVFPGEEPTKPKRGDDEESVDSFVGLDNQEDEVARFMTPPQSDDEDNVMAPLSAIPLGDYNGFGAMSPTNLGDMDDDF